MSSATANVKRNAGNPKWQRFGQAVMVHRMRRLTAEDWGELLPSAESEDWGDLTAADSFEDCQELQGDSRRKVMVSMSGN